MQLTEHVYLVGSGEVGISNDYDCHVYLVVKDDDAVLIDAGVGLESELIKRNVEKYVSWEQVSRVLCTHSHADHSGGSLFFQEEGKEVWMSDVEYDWMTNKRDEVEEALRLAKNAGSYPKDYTFRYFTPDHLIKDGETITCGQFAIQAITVKGHSPGMTCFYMETDDRNILFSGDTVFIHGQVGLLNCPGSELQGFREDIRKISSLNVDALFPGHQLFVVKNGAAHIKQAANNLDQVFVPKTF